MAFTSREQLFIQDTLLTTMYSRGKFVHNISSSYSTLKHIHRALNNTECSDQCNETHFQFMNDTVTGSQGTSDEESKTIDTGSYIASQSVGFVAGLTALSLIFIIYVCCVKYHSSIGEKKMSEEKVEALSLPRIDEDRVAEEEGIDQLQQKVEVIEDGEHQNLYRDRLGVPKVITPIKSYQPRKNVVKASSSSFQLDPSSFNYMSSITCSEAYAEV